MINLVKETISKHPAWMKSPGATLSFMKMSTPTSGRSLDKGKVLIFVFEQGLKTPTLCIKTTRSYSETTLIRQNYQNLCLLRAGIDGSNLDDLFATPLFLYDDKEVVFSIESVCRGQLPPLDSNVLDSVSRMYGDWQVHLLKSSNPSNVWDALEIRSHVKDTFVYLGSEVGIVEKIMEYYDGLPGRENIVLPVLTQHGDLTPNNVLLSSDHVSVVDYDFVGLSTLPGYDLFNFILKFKRHSGSFRTTCEPYLREYFKKIGVKILSLEALFFVYHVQEIKRKYQNVNKVSFDEIIKNYNSLISQ